MALFSQAMQMFSPFAYSRPDGTVTDPAAPPASAQPAAPATLEKSSEDAISDLKRRMEEMAAQIDRLAAGR
jgi:polyhydroxyalkanoate synthesis regulator protein